MDISAAVKEVSKDLKREMKDFSKDYSFSVNLDIGSFTTSQPRGLYNFISDIRNAKNKDEERARVDKELANIRQKFAAVASLTSRDKKKYVWKMCYMYMLGYEVDFGHLEFISLISSSKFQEKSVGYMAFSLMFRPGDELMTLVVNSMRNDLVGPLHHGKTLALAAVSNIGGEDLAEALAGEVQRLVTMFLDDNSAAYSAAPGVSAEKEYRHRALLCKKAALCLLRLFRTNPDCVVLEEWMKRMARLLEDRDLGVVTSLMSLLLGFASHSPHLFEPLVPYVISILTRLAANKSCPADYMYYRMPCPWLQVKALRFLQYYKIPSDQTQLDLLCDILSSILVKTEMSESHNKSNTDHSVLFEAINLVISYRDDAPTFLKNHVSGLLGRFIAVNDANIRYLGLDAMTRLAKVEGPSSVQAHQSTVLESLKDTDISVRKRALTLLYVLTDERNAKEIVSDLLLHLPLADATIKEDIVVKIAILAEKYSVSTSSSGEAVHTSLLEWYVNTMIQVILVAGDFVAEAVWYRIVQIVLNNSEVHEYAAEKVLASVESKWAHETVVAIAGYLLGEIGINICEQPGMSGAHQFAALHQHFPNCSLKVQSILLTTYMKLLNLYPEQTQEEIMEVFRKQSSSVHLELQQRACEYLALPLISAETMEAVLNAMPPYELESKQNILLTMDAKKEMEQLNSAGSDRSAWTLDADQKNASREAYHEHRTMQPQAEMPPPAPAAPPPPPSVDLLSLGDDATDSGSAGAADGGGGAAVGLSMEAQQKLPMLCSAALLARNTGVAVSLLSNEIVTLTLTAEYRAFQGRLVLMFENSSNYGIAQLVACTELQPGAEGALTVRQQDPPVIISAGDTGKMQLAVDSMRPFSQAYPLSLDVRFTVASTAYHYRVPLPVAPCCFYEALPTDKNTYMARWKSIEGEGTEAQMIFNARDAILDAAVVQFVKTTIAAGINLGLADGLDTDKTLTGSCSLLTGTMGADGKHVAVGVMMRLEADPAQAKFRVTTRAKHPGVAQALKNLMAALLG